MFAQICNKLVVGEMTDISITSLLEAISVACTRNEWANSLSVKSYLCVTQCFSVLVSVFVC